MMLMSDVPRIPKRLNTYGEHYLEYKLGMIKIYAYDKSTAADYNNR